jgi:PEP-CTERM motif-containing protein
VKRYILGAAIACALLATASMAQADPLLVTGGSLTDGSFSGSWTLIGDGFSLSAGTEGSAGGLFQSCKPCGWEASPNPLNFSVHAIGGPFRGGSPGTFNGVSYPTTVFDGQLDFAGPSLSAAILSPTNLVLTAPFTMTGHLVAFPNGAAEFVSMPKLFESDFIARGTATARFVQDPTEPGQPNLFEVMSVVYRFESSSAAPTPEPATLLMLGAGLVIVSHRMRRRH